MGPAPTSGDIDPVTGFDVGVCRSDASSTSGRCFDPDDASWWREDFTDRELRLLRDRRFGSERQHQWLLGRIAAKDAVRGLACRTAGLVVGRRDVEVLARASGAPAVTILAGGTTRAVSVSISHHASLAVALAAWSGSVRGVGVDIEPLSSAAVIDRMGLTDDERSAATSVPKAARARHLVALWCAKEAAVKAWGAGFADVGGPRRVMTTVDAADPTLGEVYVRAVRRPDLPALTVQTARHGDRVLASTVWTAPAKSCIAAGRWRTVAPTSLLHDRESHA